MWIDPSADDGPLRSTRASRDDTCWSACIRWQEVPEFMPQSPFRNGNFTLWRWLRPGARRPRENLRRLRWAVVSWVVASVALHCAAQAQVVIVTRDAAIECEPAPCPEGLVVRTETTAPLVRPSRPADTVHQPALANAASSQPAVVSVTGTVSAPSALPAPTSAVPAAESSSDGPSAVGPTGAAAPIRVRAWIREVVDSHPAVLAALAGQGASRSELEAARWQFFPTPSISAETAATNPGSQQRRGTGTLRLQQPVYTFGRLTHQVDRASADLAASAMQVAEERRTLALRLVQAVGDARAASLKRQAFRESASSHVEFLALVQRRVNEGLSPRGDIVLARSRLASVRADLEIAELQLSQALGRLEQLLGRPLEAVEYAALRSDQIEDSSGNSDLPDLQNLLEAAVRNSPLVGRSLARLEATQAEVEVIRSRALPEVYVRAEHARDMTGPERSQILLGLGSNFGAGLSDRSAIEAARQRVAAQMADVDARRRDMVEQVTVEYLTLQSNQRRVEVLADAASLSATVVQAWRRQFLAGRKTWQDLMNAAREKAQADAVLGEATAGRWVSRNRLHLFTDSLENFLVVPESGPITMPGAP